jgi:hypothetical protein
MPHVGFEPTTPALSRPRPIIPYALEAHLGYCNPSVKEHNYAYEITTLRACLCVLVCVCCYQRLHTLTNFLGIYNKNEDLT